MSGEELVSFRASKTSQEWPFVVSFNLSNCFLIYSFERIWQGNLAHTFTPFNNKEEMLNIL